jgi:putative oxidoreductase
MTLLRMVARPMLASMFVVGGVNALKNSEYAADRARKLTDKAVPLLQRAAPSVQVPTDPATLVKINAAVQIGAAAALATGTAPRVASAVLAGSLVPTTLAGHPYWEETDPQAKSMQKIQFFKNVSMLGGLMISAADTEGRPGLAWRARHAVKDARRESRHLAQTARREAKLARAQLT